MTDKQARYLTRLREQSRLPDRHWKALERWASVKLGGRQALIEVLKDDPEANARRMLASIFQWHRSGGDATASYIVRVLLEADDSMDVQGLQLRLGEELRDAA